MQTDINIIAEGYTIPDGINLIVGKRYAISWSEPGSEVTESCRYEGHAEINGKPHVVFNGVFSRHKIIQLSKLDNYGIEPITTQK